MKKYKVLNQNIFSKGEFKIIPIRFEDRIDIMNWRNEQMYHLRQSSKLTQEDQDSYFQKVINPLFSKERPKQLLFSYLKKKNLLVMEAWFILIGLIKMLKFLLS